MNTNNNISNPSSKKIKPNSSPHHKSKHTHYSSLQNTSNPSPNFKLLTSLSSSSSSSSSFMAESSTSSNFSSSIHSLASSDQLHTILLLLPVDSILSFSATCKRFRSLISSDTLWESICKRDWGPTSVDALKGSCSSSNSNTQLVSWMTLYKRVCQLTCVYCHELCDEVVVAGSQVVLPTPRASHSLNFVSDCLVMFGGGCEGGRDLDDTWLAYVGNSLQRTLQWKKVSSGIPSGRFGHACVVIGNYLVLFGGINDRGDRQNDTWLGKIDFHDPLGNITLSWRLLDVGPCAPPPRGAHAACCVDKKMVIHGGIGLKGVRLGDTWVLELSENFSFGSWQEIVSHPSPPARSGHTLTCIGGNQTVLFGGRGLGYEVLHDVWLLDVSEDNLKWYQILYELQNVTHGGALARVGHSATLVLGGHVLIHGGEDTARRRKDDFWALDVRKISSTRQLRTKRQTAKMWKRIKVKGYKPICRSFHRACVDHTGRHLYVFGGMVDGLLQPTEPSGLRFDGKLFLVDVVPQV